MTVLLTSLPSDGLAALTPIVNLPVKQLLQPAHHQPLEVQLGGDAQLEVEPERVVVGLEGARRLFGG